MLKKIAFKAFVTFIVVIFVQTALAADMPTKLGKSCLEGDCHGDFKKKGNVHGPVDLGHCTACHEVVNEEDHFFGLVREGRELCEKCHSGHVSGKNVHAPVEQGECLECHNPHTSGNKFLLPEKTVAKLCANCHKITDGKKHLHGPVAVGECSVCHDTHSSDHPKLLSVEPKELCVSCHVVTKDELEKFEFIHEAAKGDCVGCHDPHGADNPEMLKAEAPELCYTCHEDIKEKVDNSIIQHSVVSQKGGCLKCHTPHASTIKYILKDDPAAICQSCHDKPMGVGRDDILPSFSAEIKDKKYLHGPVKDKDCNGCHTAHGSEHFRLLNKEYPPLFYAPYAEENYELCFSCHSKDLALEDKTTKLTDFRNGNQNLHFLHVNKARRGRTCRACHETHASNLPKHIRASVPYGRWDLPIKFEKSETGGSCAPGCHKAYEYDRVAPLDYFVPEADDTEA